MGCCLLEHWNEISNSILLIQMGEHMDVASDVGVNFKNAGVLSIESSLFHLFHYTFFTN